MHTKEPWAVECDGGAISVTHDGVAICELWRRGNPQLELKDARRIVACVNACAGSSTAGLEEMSASGRSVANMAMLYERAMDRRDELLAALKEVRRWIGDGDMSDDATACHHWSPAYQKLIADTDAAISRASK